MEKFEASFVTPQGQYVGQDYNTAKEAIEAIEANGRGKVVKFFGQRNMPHCLPETVWRSSAMWVLTPEKGWQGHDIFSGHGRAYGPATPN